MITNDQLLKLFVLVPDGVSFNGTAVSGAEGEHRIFFEEATGKIWAKGIAFGDNDNSELENTINALISEDTNKSIREIAASVLNEALNATDDANTVIDNLKEILDWFKNLPEDEEGALDLVAKIGKPAVAGQDAVLYTAEDEEVIAGTKEVGDVKTPAVAAQAATGLYKVIEDSIAALDIDTYAKETYVDTAISNLHIEDYATKTHVEDRLGALGNAIEASGDDPAVQHTVKSYVDSEISDAITDLHIEDYATITYVDNHVEDRLGALGNAVEASGNDPAVPHTAKSYVDTKIGTLGNKVEAQEAVYEAVESGTTLTSGETYYTSDSGTGEFTSDGTETADGTNYFTLTSPAVQSQAYESVMEVITDNELVTAAAITNLSDRVTNLEQYNPWETYSAS